MKFVNYIKENPVVLLDVLKYVLAGLVLFGLPIPPGVDALLAGAILAVLTVATRQAVTPNAKVDAAVEEALETATGGKHRADPAETSIIPFSE